VNSIHVQVTVNTWSRSARFVQFGGISNLLNECQTCETSGVCGGAGAVNSDYMCNNGVTDTCASTCDCEGTTPQPTEDIPEYTVVRENGGCVQGLELISEGSISNDDCALATYNTESCTDYFFNNGAFCACVQESHECVEDSNDGYAYMRLLDPGCMLWCDTSPVGWSEGKCDWPQCENCSKCAATAEPTVPEETTEEPLPCKSWCSENRQSWDKLCTWRLSCGGCSECTD